MFLNILKQSYPIEAQKKQKQATQILNNFNNEIKASKAKKKRYL